ncbi:MAG TPA: cation transporting ATPase C-terminal domain-containing protein, partial [Psychromonas sp.]
VEKLYLNLQEVSGNHHNELENNPAACAAFEIMALCNDVITLQDHKGSERFHGDPTEIAMALFTDRHGDFEAIRERFEIMQTRPEILPFIAYVLFPIPLPITVVQILAIDLITDILPAIGLGNEPPEADTMLRLPRRRDERLVSLRTFVRSYAIIGPVEAAFSFLAFFLVLYGGGWQWGQTLASSDPLYGQAAGAFLTTIIFSQIGNVMACRSNRQSAWPHLTQFNQWITLGVVVELLFIITIVYTPALHRIFSTAAVDISMWWVFIIAPMTLFAIEEIRK